MPGKPASAFALLPPRSASRARAFIIIFRPRPRWLLLSRGLPPEIADEILSFFRRCVEDLSQRIGGPDAEARAFQIIATLEGGMMLARACQDIDAFDQAVAGLV
jgi:hypothetical protein